MANRQVFEWKKSEQDGLYYCSIIGGNGEKEFSSEGLHNKKDMMDTINQVFDGIKAQEKPIIRKAKS